MRHLPTTERDRLEDQLRRHVEVCERVGSHPNIAENLTAAWVGGWWWVLDRWEAAETLTQRLAQGPLGEYELPTVSPDDWPDDPYRAVEVGGDTPIDVRADLDEPSPRWGYLPNFDLKRIEEQLAKLIRQSWMLLLLIFALILAMVGGVAIQDRRLFYPAFAGALACSATLMNIGGMIFTLLRRRAAARRAEMREPDPRIERIEPVNWWSLLKAGFEPVTYQRQFRHPRLALEGCP